jgi:hypothetical protein
MIKWKYIKVASGQTIYDIAIQEYGDVTGVATVIEDNQDQLPDIDMIEDKTLRIRKDFYINKNTVDNIFIIDKPVSI